MPSFLEKLPTIGMYYHIMWKDRETGKPKPAVDVTDCYSCIDAALRDVRSMVGSCNPTGSTLHHISDARVVLRKLTGDKPDLEEDPVIGIFDNDGYPEMLKYEGCKEVLPYSKIPEWMRDC